MNLRPPSSLIFFLGGRDLEMVEIRALLEREAPGRFHDCGLAWGAIASAYREQIEAALKMGATPVLVELTNDIGLSPSRALIVDHHGLMAGAGTPTSLEQVFRLLGLDQSRWTRWMGLVSANDRAYIPGLQGAGASRDEIAQIRALDRAAQGVTAEDEAEAALAVAAAKGLFGNHLTVVRMSRARLAAVEDRLHPALGGPGVENLLLLSDAEVNFSGQGFAVLALNDRFPGGWYGGALPDRGFWGRADTPPELLQFLRRLLDR